MIVPHHHDATLLPLPRPYDMTPTQRNEAERELDWYYSVAQSMLGCPSVSAAIEARLNGLCGSVHDPTIPDAWLRAVERAVPIRGALRNMSARQVTALELAYTPRGWRGEDTVKLLFPYGIRLASLVEAFGSLWDEEVAARRLQAEALLVDALATFVRLGGVS